MPPSESWRRGARKRGQRPSARPEMLLRGDKGHPARTADLLSGYKGGSKGSEAVMSSDKGTAGSTAWLLSGDKQSAEDPADDMNDDKRCAGCTAYGTSTLTNSYLTRLSNANHDGVTQQIYVGGDGGDDYDPNAN